MEIELREINRSNFRECIRLELKPGQEQLVGSNIYSLVESRYKPGYEPYAIYKYGKMVGFILYGRDKFEDKMGQYWIIRLMVAAQYQRQGIAEMATMEAVGRMLRYRDCDYISVSTGVENIPAEKLYLKCGFVKTGEVTESQTQFVLDSKKGRPVALTNDVIPVQD